MEENNTSFGALFKKFRLKSGISTLSEFGNLMAKEGLVYEDSLFSHWQKGDRIPKDRKTLTSLLNIFVKYYGISTLEEANTLLASANQRNLGRDEIKQFSRNIVSEPIFTAPDETPFFVGREKNLKEICWQLLNKKIVLIHGSAGIGKTALAIKVGHVLKDRFKDGILWYRYDVQGIDDILNNIAKQFGEDVLRIKDKKVKAKIIINLLSEKNALLVFDNAESLEDLNLFLSSNNFSIPLLITSKHLTNLEIKFKLIELVEFTEKETLELAKKILGNPFTIVNIEKIKKLGKLVEYSPLALSILMKQIEVSPTELNLFILNFDENNNLLKKLKYDNKSLFISLNFSFNLLSKKLKEILISLGVFHGLDFSKEAVTYINKISIQEAAERLNHLHRLSLLERSVNGRYRLHSFVKKFIKEKTNNKNICNDLISYYIQFLSQLKGVSLNDYNEIEKELDNILWVYKKNYELGYYKKVVELWEYLGIFLWDRGRWKDMKKYGLITCRASLKLGDIFSCAKCLIRELSWLYYWQGDIEKTKKCLRLGESLAKKINDKFLLALTWVRYGKVYQSEKDCHKALKYLRKALLYFVKTSDQEKQGDIFTYIGETYWLMGKHKQANSYLYRALSIVNAIHDKAQKTTILSRLGCVALQEKRLTKAIFYLKKSLAMEKTLGRRVGGIFWRNLALGLSYEILGKYQKARERFLSAKKEMIFIGFSKRILKVDVFPLIFKKQLATSKLYRSIFKN